MYVACTQLKCSSMEVHTCYTHIVTFVGINRTVLVSQFPCALNVNQSIDGSHSCPYGSNCAKWPEGPHRGIISFDHMGFAYLTVFTVISLEGWITILYLVSVPI